MRESGCFLYSPFSATPVFFLLKILNGVGQSGGGTKGQIDAGPAANAKSLGRSLEATAFLNPNWRPAAAILQGLAEAAAGSGNDPTECRFRLCLIRRIPPPSE